MKARNGLKQYLEVSLCPCHRSSSLHSTRKTSAEPRKCADVTALRKFRWSEPRLLCTSMNIPGHPVPMLQKLLECTSKPFVNGVSAGLCMDFRLRIFLGRVGRGVFPPEQRVQVIACACEWPSAYDLPLSHFSVRELLGYVESQPDLPRLSLSTLWRWLSEHALRPWRQLSWIFPRDPHFLDKASPVLDLYQGLWKGEPLGPDDFVISADEKPGIQALERIQAPRPAIPGHPAHFEHEYKRHGTQAYLAALDIQSGRVFGQVHDKTGIRPFMSLVDHVMRRKPYRTARRVFWIVDNGASHQPSTFPERLRERYPNAITVHLPIHASWLNQVEIYFSIIQRKLIRHGHFPSQSALRHSILDFQYHYNHTAKPFHWSFTAAELRQRLKTA